MLPGANEILLAVFCDLDIRDGKQGTEPLEAVLAGLLAQVSLELPNCEQFSAAEEMLRECLATREKAPGADAPGSRWATFNTMSLLGGALLGRAGSVGDESEKAKLLAEAESLLVKGYEGMKAREKTIPPQGATRLAEALDRLIELYTVLNKPDEAKKYRDLRGKK